MPAPGAVRRWSTRAGRALVVAGIVAGWLVVAALVVFLLARVVAFDDARVLVLLNAYTVWIFVPAYAVLVYALVVRSGWLASAAAALVLVHLVWMGTTLFGADDLPADARLAPTLRVATVNLRHDNHQPDALARELLAIDADVVVLQEVTPRWWSRLAADGVLNAYPHQHEAVREGAGGVAIVARLPLVEETTVDLAGRSLLSAAVDVEGVRITVVDVDVVPPVSGYDRYQDQAERLPELLADVPRPVVVAGDFNSTQHNRLVRTLVSSDLTSAHDERGRSYAVTWPNGTRLAPPIRLDHVLVSEDDLAVLAVREGDGAGSDHRPVIADLAVLDALR